MGSAWIVERHRADCPAARKRDGKRDACTCRARRFRVEFRLGGAGSRTRYGGSFKRKSDAAERVRWIGGELAAMRVPDIGRLRGEAESALTFREAAEQWIASRVDVSEGTRRQQRTSVNRAVRVLGKQSVAALTPQDVAAMIGTLHEAGLKPSYLRKVYQATCMVLDHAGVRPNPARDRVIVRLPRDEREELKPPTAAHVLAAFRLLPSRYRLPLLVLDDTGMRITELELLAWGDVDEPRGRWRVSAAHSKTGRARWVHPHPDVLAAVLELCPRDDRAPARRVFLGFSGDAFRVQLGRVCIAAGVPTFSPHDLRHRRISLLHLRGVPWARIGEAVGQRSLAVTADTYSHVLVDEAELEYAKLLGRAHTVPASVPTSNIKTP